ncbi:MAG: hypothetical protein AMS16_04255 [Planctomycetes bacterium DG_58]|nr:MAG: hypothetical protein AMS16_04255 [Planctomycetes bacterium DG_58]
MAGYFFHFRPRPTNLYAKLAGRIRETQWDGALVTLNYERLLELALRNAGINLVVNPPRPNAAELELCLPHGCCHLFGHLRAIGNLNFGGNIVFDDAPGSVPRVIENAEKHACELKENKLPPIMCYIEPDKRNRTGVSFISGQRKRFECLAHSASVVGIIGVNVRSRDAHIWGPLADTPARIVYCARASGARHYSVWAEEHRPNRGDTLLLGDFEDEFDTICDAVGL